MRTNKIFVSIIFYVLLGFLAGCTSMPATSFKTFSSATHDMNVGANETYRQIELAIMDQSILTAPDAPLTSDAFKTKSQENSIDIAPYLAVMSARLAVLDSYAQSLYVLATTSEDDAINLASSNLASSVNALTNTPAGTSTLAADVVSTMGDAMGRWATYSLRKNRLEAVLTKAQPAITILAAQTNEDTSKLTSYVSILKTTYVNHANANRPKYGTWDRYQFDQLVARRFNDFDNMIAALQNINTAMGSLPTLNQQLLDSINDKKVDRKKLVEFVNQIKQLRDFEKSLST